MPSFRADNPTDHSVAGWRRPHRRQWVGDTGTRQTGGSYMAVPAASDAVRRVHDETTPTGLERSVHRASTTQAATGRNDGHGHLPPQWRQCAHVEGDPPPHENRREHQQWCAAVWELRVAATAPSMTRSCRCCENESRRCAGNAAHWSAEWTHRPCGPCAPPPPTPYPHSRATNPLAMGFSLAFRTGCFQSVVMHTYTSIKGLALRFRGGSLLSCPQGSEGVSVLEGSRL